MKYVVQPNQTKRPTSVRGAYIYNLVDLIHACLLRREIDRARRAWAILVRCPDVDWKVQWHWGLYLLTAGSAEGATLATHGQGERHRDTERWLKGLQVAANEGDKPVILSELVLYLIKVGRYRQALEELETYLPSYPYLLSATLHTYAGMICFYLAQPESARADSNPLISRETRATSASTDVTETTVTTDIDELPPNAVVLRQARNWFVQALAIDSNDHVASGFIGLIDQPAARESDDERDNDDDVEVDKRDDNKEDESDDIGMYDSTSDIN